MARLSLREENVVTHYPPSKWLAGGRVLHWTPPPPVEELYLRDVVRAFGEIERRDRAEQTNQQDEETTP
jgi:hypothetical protein